MSYELKTLKSKSANHGGTRKTSQIKYIVVHYTGNKTDTAKANANYFHNNTVKASAHYFVDDNYIYQSVDDNVIAWSVGGSKYSNCSKTGGGKMYGKITNTNSLSIELCSKNGKITDKTQNNAVTLIKKLMKKYGIPASHVYRHFDVNGKSCPGWNGWIDKSASKWNAFKKKLTVSTSTTASTSTSSTTIKSGAFVKIKIGATYGGQANGKTVPSAYIGKKYTVTKVQKNNGQQEALIKQLNSWVPTKYLTAI